MSVVTESDIFPVNFSRFGKVRSIISLNVVSQCSCIHTCSFILHLEIVGLEFDTVAGKTNKKEANALF